MNRVCLARCNNIRYYKCGIAKRNISNVIVHLFLIMFETSSSKVTRLNSQNQQYGIKDFKLNIGDYVRYITDRDKFGKRRYNVSRESYKVEDMLGNIYTLIARDGTTRNLPRWRLIKVNPNEVKRIGKTLGTDKGIVEEVLNKVSDNRVNVRFKMPDGSTYTKVINISELRMPFPQVKSKYEV